MGLGPRRSAGRVQRPPAGACSRRAPTERSRGLAAARRSVRVSFAAQAWAAVESAGDATAPIDDTHADLLACQARAASGALAPAADTPGQAGSISRVASKWRNSREGMGLANRKPCA